MTTSPRARTRRLVPGKVVHRVETITFEHLGDLPDDHVNRLLAVMTPAIGRAATEHPHVAEVIMALRAVLDGEQRRRADRLRHSAPVVTVALPAAGDLSEREMRDLMRWVVELRTRAAGGTPAVAAFFDPVLAALNETLAQQRGTLARLNQDFR